MLVGFWELIFWSQNLHKSDDMKLKEVFFFFLFFFFGEVLFVCCFYVDTFARGQLVRAPER